MKSKPSYFNTYNKYVWSGLLFQSSVQQQDIALRLLVQIIHWARHCPVVANSRTWCQAMARSSACILLGIIDRGDSTTDEATIGPIISNYILCTLLNQLSVNSTQVFWPNIFWGQRPNSVSWFAKLWDGHTQYGFPQFLLKMSYQDVVSNVYIGFIIQRGCDTAPEDLNNRTFLCHYLPPRGPFIHLECVLCPFESSIPRWLFYTTSKSVPQKFDIIRYLYSIGNYIQQKGIKMVKASIQK